MDEINIVSSPIDIQKTDEKFELKTTNSKLELGLPTNEELQSTISVSTTSKSPINSCYSLTFCSKCHKPIPIAKKKTEFKGREQSTQTIQSVPQQMEIHPSPSKENTNTYLRHLQQPKETIGEPEKCHICLYRQSIERWKPLRGNIYCPKCRFTETPLLSKKDDKETSSYMDWSTNFILHCWPLCFLPCLFSPTPQHHIHCSECFNFLGMYDESNKCILPNQEYVDYKCSTERKTKSCRIGRKSMMVQ